MTCYFKTNKDIGGVRTAATDLSAIPCDADSIKPIVDYLNDLSPETLLYDCSALELVFLRGNGEKLCDVVRDKYAEYFMAQRSMNPPRRAEPRAFSLVMESMKNADGKYKFEVSELLNEKQLTGLFSRMEKKRISGVSVARKVRGRQASKGSRKRTHPDSDEEEDDFDDEIEKDMDEEDVVMDCIKKSYADIFV